MTRDPQPPGEPWGDQPLNPKELKLLRGRFSKMNKSDLVKFYEAGLYMCQLNRGVPSRAAFVQQLVQEWREMDRRRKAKNKGELI